MDFRIMTAIRRIAASNPYSAPASGENNVESIDTDPEITEHTLYGAVVAGPDKWDDFYNIRSDWPQTGVSFWLFNARAILPTYYKGCTGFQCIYAHTCCYACHE